MVTYANLIRDSEEVSISSQQDSIESKLVEIAGFLSVLPSLTQKISSLESKVNSLEALVVERNGEIGSITKECEQLREIVGKQTPILDAKIVALEKNVASAIHLINGHTEAINTMLINY